MKNILMIGQFTDISGYGNAARNYGIILEQLVKERKINLKLINFSFESNVKNEVDVSLLEKYSLTNNFKILQGKYSVEDLYKINSYINNEKYELIFFLTNDWLLFGQEEQSIAIENVLNLNYIVKKSEKLYPCVVWETDGVPKIVQDAYKKTMPYKLMCACDWNKDVFQKDTGVESTVIPYYIEENLIVDENFKNKLLKIKNNKFAFCSVSQWNNRKGFDKLIKAFLLEFRNEEIYLFIKTYINKTFVDIDESSFFKQEVDRIKNNLSFNDNAEYKCKIVILNQIMTKQEINSIYDISDCYITTTRGEGFGLPIAEYIKFSKPVCVPNKGGHIDFISKENYFIESSFEPCENLNGSLYDSSIMNYVEPSLNSTRKKMRECYNDKLYNSKKYKKIGKNSLLYLNKHLSFDRIKKEFEKTLEIT